MITTLTIDQLCHYTSVQINNLFDDGEHVDLANNRQIVDDALNRLEYCFMHVTLKHYFDGTQVHFNHLFSDQYVMFLWYLSKSIYLEKGKCTLADKVYYLNKILHGFDCVYDTALPNIFLVFHSSGTMLGKASYEDFFVVLHGCTVGSHKGKYPILGKGVSLTANSSVIGDCIIGDRCTISTRTTLFQQNLEDGQTAFQNFNSGRLEVKSTHQCYAQQFFNVRI